MFNWPLLPLAVFKSVFNKVFSRDFKALFAVTRRFEADSRELTLRVNFPFREGISPSLLSSSVVKSWMSPCSVGRSSIFHPFCSPMLQRKSIFTTCRKCRLRSRFSASIPYPSDESSDVSPLSGIFVQLKLLFAIVNPISSIYNIFDSSPLFSSDRFLRPGRALKCPRRRAFRSNLHSPLRTHPVIKSGIAWNYANSNQGRSRLDLCNLKSRPKSPGIMQTQIKVSFGFFSTQETPHAKSFFEGNQPSLKSRVFPFI